MAFLVLQDVGDDRRGSPRNESPRPAALCTRGMRFVNLLQPLLDAMGGNLGGRNVGVAKHELNGPEPRAAFEQMRGKAVPQHVRSQRDAQTCQPSIGGKYLPHTDSARRRAP